MNQRTSRKLSGGEADKLAVVPSMMHSPDPQDSAKYEAWIRQRSDGRRSIRLTSTSRFLRCSTSTKRSVCQRCCKGKFRQPIPSTENSGDAPGAVYRYSDNISVNTTRQLPRTCTAQRQDPGDVSCDATQVPMIQKVQKSVEILQVQFIDKVVEISEIMQSKDKCQRSRRNGNSWKFTDRIVDVPAKCSRP